LRTSAEDTERVKKGISFGGQKGISKPSEFGSLVPVKKSPRLNPELFFKRGVN